MQNIINLKNYIGQEITLKGWAYNFRSSGKIFFLQLRDGSGFVQVVYIASELPTEVWEKLKTITIESSIEVRGLVKEEPRAPSGFELQGTALEIIHLNTEEYPIGKKEHGPEFLFDNRDLYLRSQTPWAVLRIRDRVFYSIEQFFHEQGFIRFDTPVLQPTSCEDTTQLFSVDYYGEPMYLSQSGQLYSEAGIMGFGKVYDFGPVFRAEKSKTRHHLSELWMMDAEMAFFDQKMNMDLQEQMVKRIVKDVLDHCQTELKILERDTTILENLVREPFIRRTHAEIKDELAADGLTVDKMDDMSTEEEIYLGEKYKLPVFITDYPAEVKSFYMKKFTDENGILRARCADLIAPEEGREIIGGSQREEDYETLKNEIITRDYPLDEYAWYLNTRKFGSVPHSGFGIGLERTVRWLTGVHHIRETIPFARMLNRNRP
jgi:asparaginyl-tRNA synthetase